MIAKELRAAWWKYLLGPLLVVAFLAAGLPSHEEVMRDRMENGSLITPDGTVIPAPEQPDVTDFMFMVHLLDGEFVFALLAVVFGAHLISGEASRGTIFLLLSKPVRRSRILLAKYVAGAFSMLVAVSLGSIGFIAVEGAYGYPIERLDVVGVSLSILLMWIGSLFVLGVSLSLSVLFGDVVKSVAVALLAGYLTSNIPVWRGDDGINPLPQRLVLPDFWRHVNLYTGEDLALVRFLVCLSAAAVPLLGALWLFNRKAY